MGRVDRKSSSAHPSGYEHTRMGSAPSLPPPSVHAFGCRRDALFEALDAVLSGAQLETPAHLSLAAELPARAGAASTMRSMPGPWTCRVSKRSSPRIRSRTRDDAWYAVDASVWPRCDAETSPDRGYYHHPYRHSHGQPIVAGWNYSWLVQVPPRCSSWTAPLRVRRIMSWGEPQPGGGRADPLLARAGCRPPHGAPHLHLRRWLRCRPAEPGLGRPAGGPVGALARRSLLLRRPDRPSLHGTTASAWRQVRL